MVLLRRLLSGTEVALVVLIDAVSNRVETTRGAEFLHHIEEFVFAVEATLAVVAGILGTVEFRSRDDLDGDSLLAGESDGVTELGAGQAGRVGDNPEHLVP